MELVKQLFTLLYLVWIFLFVVHVNAFLLVQTAIRANAVTAVTNIGNLG